MTTENLKRTRKPSKPRWESVTMENNKEKPTAVFDFRMEKPRSLLVVPISWIANDKECYWPLPGSNDEKRVSSLIKQHSEPGPTWTKLPGRCKGHFKNTYEGEAFIEMHPSSTDSEADRIALVTSQVEGYLSKDDSALRHGTTSKVLYEPLMKSPRMQLNQPWNQVLTRLDNLERAVDQKLDKITDLLQARPNHATVSKRMNSMEAQEVLATLGLPLHELDEFNSLEEKLMAKLERVRMRIAMDAFIPKALNSPQINESSQVQPLLVTRKVCRLIAPDELMQFFSRDDKVSKWKFSKRCFSASFPKLYQVLISVICANVAGNYDLAVSCFGRHLSKCSDRKTSKERVSQLNRTEMSPERLYVSETSSDDDTDVLPDSDEQNEESQKLC